MFAKIGTEVLNFHLLFFLVQINQQLKT